LREMTILACEECKRRNYHTTKSKEKKGDKLQLRKFCKFCGKHTLHKETK